MRARRVPPYIRKVEILRNEETPRGLRDVPDIGVDAAVHPLRVDRIDVVT